MLARVALCLFLFATPALAQSAPPPDPAFLQQAIASLQAQRNAALDSAAVVDAQAKMLGQEIEKMKARVTGLEKELADAKAAAAAPPK